MSPLRLVFSAAALSLFTAWSGAALADVPPPDACDSSAAVGSACNAAGPNYDQPGTCANSMCSHVGPGADGGIVTSQYPCVLCQATASASTGSGASSSGSSSSGSSGGGSSCAVGVVGSEGMMAGTMLLLGLGVLLADRRRRAR